MLVLLPPSETKAVGGETRPLDWEALSFAELTPTRRKLADALVDLARDTPASLRALGLSARQEPEVRRNALLYRSPTMPALQRYTGVLYDALDTGSLDPAAGRLASQRLAVTSALFGVLRADDPIPAYRLSGGSRLPGFGPLAGVWRAVLEAALAGTDELIVDLRSGTYAALARLPGAVSVRVVTADQLGRRATVSHHNKAHKGRLARILATTTTEPGSVEDVLTVASAGGLRVERTGDRAIELLV